MLHYQRFQKTTRDTCEHYCNALLIFMKENIQENKTFRKVFNAEYVHIFTVSFTDPDVNSIYVKSYELV